MLSDTSIANLIEGINLISPHDPNLLRHCRYNLRAGRVFSPETGAEQIIGQADTSGNARTVWTIQPTETLVIMTVEHVNMPDNLVGEYGQLYRWARQGLVLANTSIIEPGYSGPLSCVLVNLSKQALTIEPETEIAKLTFHELDARPREVIPETPSDEAYARKLAESASKHPASFLDILRVEDRVVEKASRAATRSVTVGGIAIGVLILWSTIEPPLSNYLWDRFGFDAPSGYQDATSLLEELNADRAVVEQASKLTKDEAVITSLQRQVQAQARTLNDLRAKVDR